MMFNTLKQKIRIREGNKKNQKRCFFVVVVLPPLSFTGFLLLSKNI